MVQSARDRLRQSGRPPSADELTSAGGELAAILLAGFADRSVELHVLRPPFSVEPGERPEANPLARAQAECQPWVTSLRHDLDPLSDQQRLLVRHLDGTRCRSDLLDLLTNPSGSTESRSVDEVIDLSWIDAQLRWLSRRGILCRTRPAG